MNGRMDGADIAERLEGLDAPVRLLFFTQTLECETCIPTRQILDEVASASDRVSVVEYNLQIDREVAAEYGVSRPPTVAVVGPEGTPDTGIRFVGIPAGYELASLLDAITLVSAGDSGLAEESRALLAGVEKPIDVQVFVTPT